MLGKVGEATRQNRGLVAQALEFGEQGFGTFGQAQRRADGVQHINVQAFEQGQTLFETGAEVQLTGHGPLGDFRDLVTHAGRLGQFVDHFSFDQR
ncbi:hypothetical protein D9M72_630840 [compost metagenome]